MKKRNTEVLLVLLFVMLIGSVGCANLIYHRKTQANKGLIQFPEKISGACKIVKYMEPDAKGCLVHLWNLHYSSDMDTKEQSNEVQKIIERVQKDNYSILKNLNQNTGLKKVYIEGEMINPDRFNYLVEEKAVEMKNVLDEFLPKIDLTETHNEVKGKLKLLKARRKEYYKYDAVERLKKEGVIMSTPAEEAKAKFEYWFLALFSRIRNQIEIKGYEYKKLLKQKEQNREDALLKIIYDNKDPFSVVVYGAGHYWGDNIVNWNKHNPEYKFSYIIIIPEALKPYLSFN